MHSQYTPKDYREWSRPGYIGGNKLYGGACNLEFSYHFSGSGLGAFGEREHWPAVRMTVAFPEGRDEVALKLIELLQGVVDDFLEENDLKIPDGCRDKDYYEK